jgi:hypothetical protein
LLLFESTVYLESVYLRCRAGERRDYMYTVGEVASTHLPPGTVLRPLPWSLLWLTLLTHLLTRPGGGEGGRGGEPP